MWWVYFIAVAGFIFLCVVAILIWLIMASNKIVVLKKRIDRNYPLINSKLKEYSERAIEVVSYVERKTGNKTKAGEGVKKLAKKTYEADGTLNKITENEKLSKKVDAYINYSKRQDGIKKSRRFSELETKMKSLSEEILNIKIDYNNAVEEYNKKIATSPSKMIAERFKFKQATKWEIKE